MSPYKIIDKTSNNEMFDSLVKSEDGDEVGIIKAIVKDGKEIETGDMFWIRDSLIKLGYELWKDFEIKKIGY